MASLACPNSILSWSRLQDMKSQIVFIPSLFKMHSLLLEGLQQVFVLLVELFNAREGQRRRVGLGSARLILGWTTSVDEHVYEARG